MTATAKETTTSASSTRGQAGTHEGRPRADQDLVAGHLIAGQNTKTVRTVLGSCVAVYLVDRTAGVWGVNHYLLPEANTDMDRTSVRFGDVAIMRLIERVEKLGASRKRLVAKIFGGASVVGGLRGALQHIGSRNIEVAREELKKHQIPIVAEDVGGSRGRTVIFQPADGSALVREL